MKSRAILAVLAATPGHCQTRSWLQDLLWQDRQAAQAQSSLRSALADIRRHLGAWSGALQTNHYEVSLDLEQIRVEASDGGSETRAAFLQGFEVPNAQAFEDWMHEQRGTAPAVPRFSKQSMVHPRSGIFLKPQHGQNLGPQTSRPQDAPYSRIFLASPVDQEASVARMQCDALVDCIAKSAEDLGLAALVDGRGQGAAMDTVRAKAATAQCDLVLVSETASGSQTSVNRLRALDCETGTLIWSKSLMGDPVLDLDHPANVGVVAEFVELLTERLVRPLDWQNEAVSPQMMAITGMNHIFKLGPENFKTADRLLQRAFLESENGCALAWRAFLRTFQLGERDCQDHETIIEEGADMARRAVEIAPLNSMVLALCGHVEAMLRDDYGNAIDLAGRSLALNRCNPIAWACLGRSASFAGDEARGQLLSQYGARLAKGARYSFLVDSWASSSGLLAQDIVSARLFCESSHSKAPTFAPPMRFLSALYCADAEFERADVMVAKLKQQEPDFDLHVLRDEGYPSDSLKRANVLDNLPQREL